MKPLQIATVVLTFTACLFAQILDVPGDGRFTGNLTVSGYVGIGTTNPQSLLHVSGGQIVEDYYADAISAAAFIGRKANGTVNSPAQVVAGDKLLALHAEGWTSSGAFSINTPSILFKAAEAFTNSANGSYITFETSPIGSALHKERMIIGDNGYVGIGTASPSEMLEVAGNIKCSSVKINNWSLEAPDYVFEKGYKLPSLKEVEKQVTTHKHLAEVPSAAEMKSKGVDVAEINMALLKKVEELTLYAIEQNKRIEALEKRDEGK